MENSASVLLIDDHQVLLDGMRLLLSTRLPSTLILTASNLQKALQLEETPAAIVLDIKLPGINGLDGLALLRRKWPDTCVVVLSSQDDPATQQEALQRGASGFISKTEAGTLLAELIASLLAGQAPESCRKPGPAESSGTYLTPRQCEVLDLLCQGLANKVIARHLEISDNTVRRHLQDIFNFLGVSNRTEAVLEARRRKLVW